MPRYSANLSILFTERPFAERFGAARRAGFEAVECWFPYDTPAAELRAILDREELILTGINTAPGNVAAGEWGLAALPGREADFRASFEESAAYALALGRPQVHVLAGNLAAGQREAGRAAYLANLAWATGRAEAEDLHLLIEPLNRRDRPDYALSTAAEAAEVIAAVGSPRLRLLFDAYHVAMAGDDVFAALATHYPIIGHVQVAAVPSRAEPDEGTLDHRALLAALDGMGWRGWVGAEYKPRGVTEDGLGWRARLAV